MLRGNSVRLVQSFRMMPHLKKLGIKKFFLKNSLKYILASSKVAITFERSMVGIISQRIRSQLIEPVRMMPILPLCGDKNYFSKIFMIKTPPWNTTLWVLARRRNVLEKIWRRILNQRARLPYRPSKAFGSPLTPASYSPSTFQLEERNGNNF